MTNNEIQQQHQQQLLILNSNSYSQQAASMNLNQTHNNHHQHQHHQPPPQQQQQQQQQNQHHHHHQQALQQTQPQHHQHHNQQQQQQHLNQNHHQLHQHHHNSHNNHQHHASHNHSHRGQQQASANGDGNANQMLKKELPANGKKTKGRVRIKMEFIHNKLRRYTTFSKRKTGIMKKAFELATLTGTQVMLLVASETGHVYTFATRKLQPMIISDAGKALIQTCLNSPDSDNLLISASAAAAAAAAASSTATPNSNGCNNASNSGNLAPSTTTTAAQATPTAGATNATATPASVGPSHSMVSGQLSPLSSSHGASTPNSGSPPNQQRAPVSGNEHVEQQQQQLYADSSLNSQKSLNLNLNLGQASNGNCSSSSSVNNIQSQHNMLLAATSSTPSSSSSPSNCSLGPATNAHLSNQHITNTNSNNSNNSGHSTTDQRMSATGFEETELSYSINDDLNDRTFNNCLPISIGTISNNGGANVPSGNSTSTSTSIITSSQAFEQTLKDHRQADNLIESVYLHNGYNNNDGTNDESIVTALENPNQNRVQIVGNRRLVHQHGNKNYTIDSDTQFHARMPQNLSGPLRDPSIEFQLAQFNYNPLYTGLQQQQQQQTRLNQQQSVGLNSQQQHKREKQSRQLNNLMIDNQISQQQQQQQQMNFQQQFTLVSSSNNSNTQLDLSEECGGLFVEYQTNRVNSMGDLEELNSLNVTNCVDSEALEEQINMLSSSSDRHNHQNLVEGNEEEEDDDCFASNDDLNDFGIGSSNDHFLNMLFLGGNGNSASAGSNGNLEAFASNQQDIMQQQGGNNVGLSFDSHQSEQNQQQSLICNQVGETGLNNNINANSSHQHQLQIQQQTDKGGARRRQEANKLAIVNKVTNTRKRSKRNDRSSENSIATAQQAPSQNKINTTNTNKRLLPKKNQQQQQPGLASNGNKTCVKKIRCARNVWSASPSSSTTSASNSSHSSSAMLSPSSSSQFEYDQAPYRQQLENLRKKLKMDAPNSISLIPVLQNKGCQLKDQNQEELLSPQQATSATGILVNCQTQNQLEANQVMLVASEPQYLIARTIEQFEAGSLIYFSGPNGISQPIDTETSPSGDTRNQGQQAPEPLKHSNDMSSKQGSSQVPLIAETPPGSSDQMNSQQDFVSTEIGSEQMQTNESLNTNGSKNTSVANRGPKPLMNSNGQEQAERVRASHSRGEKLESQQMSLFCSGQHDQQQQSSSILLEDVVNIVETSCSSSNATSTNDQCNVSAAEPPTISMETNILDRLPILQFRDQPKSIALEERLL